MKTVLQRLWIIILVLVFAQGCNSQNGATLKSGVDRPMYAAGKFYSSNPAELRNILKNLFEHSKRNSVENVLAVICPHAGYEFSGTVAASAYSQVDPDKTYENVFIIASSHKVSFEGASIYNQGDYVTPLGKVKVNIELASQLMHEHPVFSFHADADRDEHSCEVQVPFLQYRLKNDFKLVPVILGTQTAETCKKIAEALKPYFNEHNLFVISSDFSHYPSYDDANLVDKQTCDAILTNSPDQLLKILQSHENQNVGNLVTSLCGWTSVLTFLDITTKNQGYNFTAIDYKNSGDSKSADKKQVVGYWAIAISMKGGNYSSSNEFGLSIQDKKELLKIARTTLESYIRNNKTPEITAKGYPNALLTPCGAFVTLKEKGELRGCIGRFSSEEPLYKVIRAMTIAASTEDTRFEPVSEKEIEKVEIEISVLSPMKKIKSIDEIVLGKHGIYIKQGYLGGTFLPQVATETGWTKEEFLSHCSHDKAGLGWNGWKDADIYIYSAEVFSEKEINGRKD